MAKTIIVDEIPLNYTIEKLGEGYSAECFLTGDGQVFKRFFTRIKYLSDLLYLSEYKSEVFKFPEAFVYRYKELEENLLGYLMQYATGTRFDLLELDTKFKELTKAIFELEKEMHRLTLRGLIITDMNSHNMFYDKEKGIQVVDTDLYIPTLEDDFRNMYRRNIMSLSETIISRLVGINEFKSKTMKDLVMNCGGYGKIRPSQMLEGLADEAISLTGENIETLGEFKEKMIILKKNVI